MKHFIIIFLIYFGSVNAQNITLDNLINLRSKNLAEVEEYLSMKNWSFLKTTNETTLKNVIFTYNKNDYSDYAQSFITYMYSDYDDPSRIYMQLSNKDIYNEYISRLKSFNCKLVESSAVEGNVVKVYQGKTTTFVVTIMMSDDDNQTKNNLYTFHIMGNSDFTDNYRNGN